MSARTSLFAAAVCGAFALWASPSAADDLVPGLSIQTGVAYTRSPAQGGDQDDYFVAATPSLTYFIDGDRTVYSFTYSFTGSINSALPNGIANRLAVATNTDVTPTTQLLFGAEALQSMIGNYLLVRRSAQTQIGAIPALNTQLLTLTLSQGIAHELSPVLRLNQGVTATYVTSLDPDTKLDNYLAGVDVGVARSWEFDALGVDTGFQYARTSLPPLDNTTMTVQAGPTWDHDLSRTLTMSLSVAAQLAFSPDPKTVPQLGPAGRASILYAKQGSGVEASYSYGIAPNVLLGSLLRSHLAQIRGFTPISEAYNVTFGVSAGYLVAENVDLATRGRFDSSVDAVLHDADVSWGATEYLNLFVRYQFIGQARGTGPAGGDPLVRHAAILGLDIFGARRAIRQRTRVQTQFGRRVDGSDRTGGADPRPSQAPAPRR